MKDLTNDEKKCVKILEKKMNERIKERSRLNYEINHLQESILMIKEEKTNQ